MECKRTTKLTACRERQHALLLSVLPCKEMKGCIYYDIYFLVAVWLIFYTPILNKILFPNGKKAFDIIHKLAKSEFGNDISECKNYLDLKRGIIKSLNNLNEQQFEENTLATVVNIEHLKQNDFGNYMALKFSYRAIILATVSIIDLSTIFEFLEKIGLNKIRFIGIVFILFTVFLLVMGNTIRNQHNRLEYLNFKLLCINMIKCEKEKHIQNLNSSKKGRKN